MRLQDGLFGANLMVFAFLLFSGVNIPLDVLPGWMRAVSEVLPFTHGLQAIRAAVGGAGLLKRVTAHTFRHTYATHLLQANYDIRTIQDLLGHSDIRTTMIYTHTIKSRTIKETKSPLDFQLSQ